MVRLDFMAIFAIVEVESHSCKHKSRSTNGIFVPVRLHCTASPCILTCFPHPLKTHEQLHIYGHVLHNSYISFDKDAQLIENIFVAILEFLLYSSLLCKNNVRDFICLNHLTLFSL